MKKVLHIITRLEKGGAAKNVLESLDVNGFNNFLIYGQCDFSETIKKNKNIFKIKHLTREISPLNDIFAFFEIYFLVKKISPDIIHTHTSKAGVLGRLAAFFYNFPTKKAFIIHTPHGHLLYGYYSPVITLFFKIIEKLLSFLTDKFIALTEGEKKESIEAGFGNLKDWTVIHSGIDFPEKIISKKDARQKLMLSDKSFVLLFVGRLEKVKGPDIFIDIANELERKAPFNNLYLIVGEGSMRQALEEEVKKTFLFNKIIFARHTENIFDYYAAADLLIQPSRNEAMGRTVIEAQYCGLPVLVSDACGLPYVSASGLVFRNGDYKQAAEMVSKFYDENFRNEKIRQSVTYARKTDEKGILVFSSTAMKMKLENLYSTIL